MDAPECFGTGMGSKRTVASGSTQSPPVSDACVISGAPVLVGDVARDGRPEDPRDLTQSGFCIWAMKAPIRCCTRRV
jgi:hypothetical protein